MWENTKFQGGTPPTENSRSIVGKPTLQAMVGKPTLLGGSAMWPDHPSGDIRWLMGGVGASIPNNRRGLRPPGVLFAPSARAEEKLQKCEMRNG